MTDTSPLISRYEEEPKPAPYCVPFAPELIPLILEGRKVKTYRLGLKYDYLSVGDKVKIQNWDTQEIIGEAVVTHKERTTFDKLPLENPGHEPYNDKESQRKVFSHYYAYIKRPLKDDDLFLIIEFRLARN